MLRHLKRERKREGRNKQHLKKDGWVVEIAKRNTADAINYKKNP